MHAKAGRSRPPTTLKTKSPVCWWTHDPDEFVREEVEGGCRQFAIRDLTAITHAISHIWTQEVVTLTSSPCQEIVNNTAIVSPRDHSASSTSDWPTQCREEKKSAALVLRCNDYHFQGRSKEHRGRDSRDLSKSTGIRVHGPRGNRVWTRTLLDGVNHEQPL